MLSRNLKLFFGKRKWLQNDKTSRGFNLLLNLNYWFWRVKRFVMQCGQREEQEKTKHWRLSLLARQCNNDAWKNDLPVNTVMHWVLGGIFFRLSASPINIYFSNWTKIRYYIYTQRKAQNWRGHWWGQWLKWPSGDHNKTKNLIHSIQDHMHMHRNIQHKILRS